MRDVVNLFFKKEKFRYFKLVILDVILIASCCRLEPVMDRIPETVFRWFIIPLSFALIYDLNQWK